ncbi:MAG: glutamate carboxypeptidase [Frankiales bacterium]|nr:glutamate carboxypeptidase [Frankiales bacterium]
MPRVTSVLRTLTERTEVMLEHLAALVDVESPTADLAATTRAADAAAELGQALLGAAPERIVVDERTHLRWRFGAADRVVLIGHLDTVWPLGTTAEWPLRVEDGIASGPGTFDMKAGVVQLLHALAVLDSLDGVAVLLTTDEETGSPSSRALIEETALAAGAALVLEGAADGAVKTQRKGVSMYELHVRGLAAHAGVEPEKGVNATLELAHQALAIAELQAVDVGTTVTPTVAHAGTTTNTVPAEARLSVDVRAETAAEQWRVDAALHALTPVLLGAVLRLEGAPNRPPLERRMSVELFDRACALAADLGLDPLAEISVGGGSDGNFTAGIGVPTLDGLGAVGGGAHARSEHIVVAELARRSALVSALVAELLR